MKNPGIPNGVYYGGTAIVIATLVYFMNPAYYINYRSVLVFILSFYFLYQTAIIARATLGGYITVGEAFVPSFSTWVIGTLISTLFAYIFINFIDPSLIDLTLQIAMEAADKMEPLMGEEFAETMRETLEENGVNLSIGALLMNWLVGLIVGAFVAFVVSLIVKREDRSIV